MNSRTHFETAQCIHDISEAFISQVSTQMNTETGRLLYIFLSQSNNCIQILIIVLKF